MHETLLEIGDVVFVVYAVVSTVYMMNAGQKSVAVCDLVKSIKGIVNATPRERKGTLRNMNKITSNISTVKGDVRQISDTVIRWERTYDISINTSRMSSVLKGGTLSGLKAGIKIEVATLVETLHKGRGDRYERGTDEQGKLNAYAFLGRRFCGGRISAPAGSKAGKGGQGRH